LNQFLLRSTHRLVRNFGEKKKKGEETVKPPAEHGTLGRCCGDISFSSSLFEGRRKGRQGKGGRGKKGGGKEKGKENIE